MDSKVTRPQIKHREQWFYSWQEQWIIRFSLVSLLAMRIIQQAMKWVGGSFPLRQGRWGLNLAIKLQLVLRLLVLYLHSPHSFTECAKTPVPLRIFSQCIFSHFCQ
jgi:hypothetical protein